MDIHEQVNKVIRNMETRERKAVASRRVFEGSLLAEMAGRYNRYIAERNWERAQDCLMDISRLVVCMLAE